MLEKIFNLFGTEAVHKSAMILSIGSQIIKTIEKEFANDASAKNAAIDMMINILQSQKDPETPKT